MKLYLTSENVYLLVAGSRKIEINATTNVVKNADYTDEQIASFEETTADVYVAGAARNAFILAQESKVISDAGELSIIAELIDHMNISFEG